MRWGRWWRREITRNICAQWDLCSLPDTCDPPSSPPPTHPQIPHCPHRGNHDPFPYSSARALPIPTTLWDHSLLELVCKHCCKKCYHLGALKEQKFILLLFRRLEVRTEGIGRVRSFLGAPRSIVPCLSPGGRWRPLAAPGVPWLLDTSLQPVPTLTWHSPSGCVCLHVAFFQGLRWLDWIPTLILNEHGLILPYYTSKDPTLK